MVITNKINNTLDNNNMKRIKYISLLHQWLQSNPEVLVQQLLPECILTELYYYERVQQNII
jgi:hypothetical protein